MGKTASTGGTLGLLAFVFAATNGSLALTITLAAMAVLITCVIGFFEIREYED